MTESHTRFSTAPLPVGQRVALCVQYDGSDYAGWQAQEQLPGVRTVQSEVERALESVCAAPVRIHCAGRTDAGVHAVAQWIHFDLPSPRSVKACVVGANAQLPEGVRVGLAQPVPGDFHARHSAQSRQYDYLISNSAVAPALLARRALWCREPLDAAAMGEALGPLLGERDFSAFRAAACQSRTPMRFLAQARAWRRGEFVQVRLTANAFLHHMVRNIVGSLLLVGRGEKPPEWIGALLAAGDRTRAGATAPAHGLYLSDVTYPPEYALASPPPPPFLQPPPRV